MEVTTKERVGKILAGAFVLGSFLDAYLAPEHERVHRPLLVSAEVRNVEVVQPISPYVSFCTQTVYEPVSRRTVVFVSRLPEDVKNCYRTPPGSLVRVESKHFNRDTVDVTRAQYSFER